MSLLEEILSERGIKIADPSNKPRCFDKCTDRYCDMEQDHCSNRDFPVMSKCVNCHYYFGWLEKQVEEQ